MKRVALFKASSYRNSPLGTRQTLVRKGKSPIRPEFCKGTLSSVPFIKKLKGSIQAVPSGGGLSAGQTSAIVGAVITVNNVPSAAVSTSIIASAPGIYTIPATGQGHAILTFLNPATNQPAIAAPASAGIAYPTAPIPRGTGGFFYVNGLGAMTPSVPDGSGSCPATDGVCNANAMPTVLVGGITAPVAFAGQAPGFPGVYQVNITIPQNAPTGSAVPLVVRSADGTVTSNAATIAIQ